jgi:hypothetical protein
VSATTRRDSLIRTTVAQIAEQAHSRVDQAFDPSGSPWHQRAIFVTGAPRSGTSWLHQMLLTHPSVVTGGELHVFCEGLAAVYDNFENPDPYMHLSTWVTRSELTALCRNFIDGVFSAASHASPRKTEWVLDKTPNHAACARLLAEVYPDATYVQIIRNPRDAISSARDLWSDFNPRLRNWQRAATDWKTTVEDCRLHLSGLRYHEVRYEDLLAETETEFAAILDAAGLPHDPSYVEQAVEFGRAPVNVRPSDQRISDAKWADIERAAERDIVEVAGDLMVELGYLAQGDRERIVGRPDPRRALSAARAQSAIVARTLVPRTARRLTRRLRPNPANVMQLVRKLIDTAVAGDVAGSIDLLSPQVTLDVAGTREATGRQHVAPRLCELLRGTQAIPTAADREAAAVEVIASSGPRQQHRYYVERGHVARIVIDGVT